MLPGKTLPTFSPVLVLFRSILFDCYFPGFGQTTTDKFLFVSTNPPHVNCMVLDTSFLLIIFNTNVTVIVLAR